MFAGMIKRGILITKLGNLEREELEKFRATKPFVAGDKIIRSRVSVDLDSKDLSLIMPFVKKSYERAITSGN